MKKEYSLSEMGLPGGSLSGYKFVYAEDIPLMLNERDTFVHKGDMGRARIIAGSYGMMGAAIICNKACINYGVGLLTAIVPKCGYNIIQTSVPEAMCITSTEDKHIIWTEQMYSNQTNAIAIGPGIGRLPETEHLVKEVLKSYSGKSIVIDADGLYHLASLLKQGLTLPEHCILTPHEAEFDRLTHAHNSRIERIHTAIDFAKANNTTIVLKGAFTAIVQPNGEITFNTTGNPGMATGGMGDMLTGIITALLAQGYSCSESAILGVCMHGHAGDKAKELYGEIGVTPTRMLNLPIATNTFQ